MLQFVVISKNTVVLTMAINENLISIYDLALLSKFR